MPTSNDFIAPLVTSGGLVHRPGTLQEVQEVTEQFLLHYNQQRPHQGRWLSQPTATGGLPGLPDVAYSSRDGGS